MTCVSHAVSEAMCEVDSVEQGFGSWAVQSFAQQSKSFLANLGRPNTLHNKPKPFEEKQVNHLSGPISLHKYYPLNIT